MQRFASSLIARPVVSSIARSTLYRAMSVSASQIKEHSMVLDSQGKEFAKVDHMQGADKIKLTRDSTGGDVHHFIPLSWVNKVEGNNVHITKTADEAKAQWTAGQE